MHELGGRQKVLACSVLSGNMDKGFSEKRVIMKDKATLNAHLQARKDKEEESCRDAKARAEWNASIERIRSELKIKAAVSFLAGAGVMLAVLGLAAIIK